MSDPTIPGFDPYTRLARFRAAGWEIDDRRDNIAIYSALKRPSRTSLVYIVSHTIAELVLRIEAVEAGLQRDALDKLADSFEPPAGGETT